MWGAVACGLYLLTAARDLSWAHSGADGGDLVTAAWVGGVPHPSGYPLWSWLASALLALPLGTPAWRAGLISVLGGAVAVGAAVRAAAWLLPVETPPFWRQAALALAGASLAVAPLLWGQSVIVEVYGLQAGLMALALEGLVAWAVAAEGGAAARGLARAALVWGLALANHLTALLLAPTLLWLLWQRRGAGRGALVRAAPLLLIGPLLYLTIPLRAVALPPINWGGASTLAGLRWLVSGEIYRHFLFALPPAEWGGRLLAWAALLAQQFGPVGLVLAFWGGALLAQRHPRLVGALLLFVALLTLYAIGYNTTDSFTYLLPTLPLFTIFLARALAHLPAEAGPNWGQGGRAWLAAGALALLLPGLTVARFGRETAQWGPQPAAAYVAGSLAVLPPQAIVFAQGDEHIFAMWYAAYVVAPEKELTVVVEGLLPYGWYRETLRANHPALAWPADPTDPRAILDANRAAAPIFLTDGGDAIASDLPREPVGPLWRIP